MTHRKFQFIILLVILLIPSFLRSQEPSLQFNTNTGALKGGPVYGRYFSVKGSTKQPFNKDSDLIRFKIFEVDGSSKKERYNSSWKRTIEKNSGEESTKFEFYVNRQLKFNTTYSYEFKFYEKVEIEEDVASTILEGVKQHILSSKENFASITVDDVHKILITQVNKYLASKGYSRYNENGDKIISSLDPTSLKKIGLEIALIANYQTEITKRIDALKLLKDEQSKLINQIISNLKVYNEVIKSINYKGTDLAGLDNSFQDMADYQAKMQPFETLFLNIALIEEGYGADTIRTARNQLNTFNSTEAEGIRDKLKHVLEYYLNLQTKIGNIDLADNADILAEIIKKTEHKPSLFDKILTESQHLKTKELNLSLAIGKLYSNVQTIINKQDNLEQYYQAVDMSMIVTTFEGHLAVLTEEFSELNIYSTTATESVRTTEELQAIRIGTAIGGAFIGPFNKKSPQVDAISYVGLKFYSKNNPVDRRLVNPFLNPNKKFPKAISPLLGIVIAGNPSYKGEPIKDIIGVKPLLGASLDFNRYLSFDAGMIFFKHDPISPLKSGNELGLSFFAGISLDADAFNRFKSLFNSENYLINQKN